jgi:uracil-DNA glycosylase
LTVRAGEPASHSKVGRQIFTDAVIKKLSEEKSHLVFLLRGNYAISKKALIDNDKHLILTGVHPSPLSASRGWFGCNHFRLANEYLSNE